MIVDIACLYTSCECPSRRSSTQKLSNQVTTPCSFTPFTRKIVSGVLFLRTWLRKVSCRFCERSAAIVAVPSSYPAGPFPRGFLPSRRAHFLTTCSHRPLDWPITGHVREWRKHKLDKVCNFGAKNSAFKASLTS